MNTNSNCKKEHGSCSKCIMGNAIPIAFAFILILFVTTFSEVVARIEFDMPGAGLALGIILTAIEVAVFHSQCKRSCGGKCNDSSQG